MKRRSKSKIFSGIAAQQMIAVVGTPLALLVVCIFLILFSSFYTNGLSGFRTGIINGFVPLLQTITKPFHASVDFVSNVSGMAELRAENAKLQAENARLREWYQTALILQSENQSLKDLLNLKVEPHFEFVSTRILSDAGNAFVKSVLAGAGTTDGVKKNQPVISGEGVIGRIVETGSNVSRVLLLTDFNSRVPVMIEGSRQRAILSGNNTSLPMLKHIQQDTLIEDGMRVVTSGHGGLFAPGLPVGVVQKTAGNRYAVKLHADMNRVSHIRILNVKTDPYLRAGQIE